MASIGHGLTVEVEQVTPAKAAAYLSKSQGNRNLRQTRIAAMVAALQAGKWRLHHQGIAFDKGGKLIDGHHRLTAIQRSGIAAPLIVVRGVQEEASVQIDAQLPRSIGDALLMGGRERPDNTAVSIARMIEFAPAFHPRSWVTRDDVVMLLEWHADAIAFACTVGRTVGWSRGFRVLLARAFYVVEDRERLNEFVSIVRDGVAKDVSDSAAIKVRDFLARDRAGTGWANSEDVYRRSSAGCAAFMEHRPLDVLRNTMHDLFPLPGERRLLNPPHEQKESVEPVASLNGRH